MTTYNESASSFESLKATLKQEFVRRNAAVGGLSSSTIGSNTAVAGENIDDMSGVDVINNALMIADIEDIAFVEEGDILPDISKVRTALTNWSKETMEGSSSCRGYCTGLCQGSCVGGCTGCGGNCTQTCGVNCGSCTTTCTRTCGGNCTTTCGKSCTNACAGCVSGCYTACSGCSTTTKTS